MFIPVPVIILVVGLVVGAFALVYKEARKTIEEKVDEVIEQAEKAIDSAKYYKLRYEIAIDSLENADNYVKYLEKQLKQLNNPFAVNKPEGYEVKSAEFVRDSEGNWTTKNVQFNRRH